MLGILHSEQIQFKIDSTAHRKEYLQAIGLHSHFQNKGLSCLRHCEVRHGAPLENLKTGVYVLILKPQDCEKPCKLGKV